MLTFFRKRRRAANSSLINRDLGNRELLRSAQAAEEAERLDSVPVYRSLAELEREERRQRAAECRRDAYLVERIARLRAAGGL